MHQSDNSAWLNTFVSVYLNNINQNLPSIVKIGDESSAGFKNWYLLRFQKAAIS